MRRGYFPPRCKLVDRQAFLYIEKLKFKAHLFLGMNAHYLTFLFFLICLVSGEKTI